MMADTILHEEEDEFGELTPLGEYVPRDNPDEFGEVAPSGEYFPRGDSDEPEGATGFRVPTDESLDAALDSTFDNMVPRLEGNPTLGALEWEKPRPTQQAYGFSGSSAQTSSDFGELIPIGEYTPRGETEDDDYGWGIQNAFMRGLIRAGSLVDVAQGDYEELAEGMKALEQYPVSEDDQARLTKLQEKDGFWESLGSYIANPSLALQIVAESLPMSSAPLALGAAGALAAGPPGAMVGAGIGSFATEYLNSISEVFAEDGVDLTDATQLKAAFANDELMGRAREHGVLRGIPIAAMDALSMGIAGRIYKPAKALTGAATKTGAVIGGTSELLAQGFAGAGGEVGGQLLSGQGYSGQEAAAEFIGELVPGVAEIGINKLRGKDAAGGDIDVDDTTPSPTPPPVTPEDLTATPEGDVADIVEDTTVLPDTDIDEEGKAYSVPPEGETTTEEATSVDAATEEGAAPSEEVVFTEVPQSEESTAPAEEASTEEDVSPLIDTKQLREKLKTKFTAFEKNENDKVSMPALRGAIKKLVGALTRAYPDVELPIVQRRFGAIAIAKFFKELQEKVDLTTDLPNLKQYLEQAFDENTSIAEMIESFTRVAGAIVADMPSKDVGEGGPTLTQLKSVVNKFDAYTEEVLQSDKAEKSARLRRAKTVEKAREAGKSDEVIANLEKKELKFRAPKIPRAQAIGELAVGIKKIVDEIERLGGDIDSLPADLSQNLATALKYEDQTMAPTEKGSPKGRKTKKIAASDRALDKVGDALRKAVPIVSELYAAVEPEVSAKQEVKKGDPEKMARAPVDKVKKSPIESDIVEDAETVPTPSEALAKQRAEQEGLAERSRANIEESKKILARTAALEEEITEEAPKAKAAVQTSKEKSDAAPKAEKAKKTDLKKEEVKRQKKLVPARFRGKKFFFHSVRNDEDVASIVKGGLRPGTNVSRIGGQALSDEGGTILVFEGKTAGQKTYQEDELAAGGEKPIAIIKDTSADERPAVTMTSAESLLNDVQNDITMLAEKWGITAEELQDLVYDHDPDLLRSRSDHAAAKEAVVLAGLGEVEAKRIKVMGRQLAKALNRGTEAIDGDVAAVTSTDVINKYREHGLPVYDTAGNQAEPDVKGAAPDEVFDPEIGTKNIKGRQGTELAEFSGFEEGVTITQALKQAGVSIASANKIKAIMEKLSAGQARKLVAAIEAFGQHGDKVRFAAEISNIVGGKPVGPGAMNALMEFGLGLEAQRIVGQDDLTSEADMAAEQEVKDEYAREQGYKDFQEMEDIEGEAGFGTEGDGNYFTKKAPPLKGVNKGRRLKDLVHESERFALGQLFRRLLAETSTDTSMKEVLGIILNTFPKNHVLYNLAQRLEKLNLDIPISFHNDPFEVVPDGGAGGVYHSGARIASSRLADGRPVMRRVFNPEEQYIRVLVQGDIPAFESMLALMHEMVHAATIHTYETDPAFQEKINRLWARMIKHAADNDPEFRLLVDGYRELFQEVDTAQEIITQFLQDKGLYKGFYGMINPVEMIAEAFTRPDFQQFLDGIPAENENANATLFSKIIDAVKEFFGYSTRNSVLNQLITVSEEKFNTQEKQHQIAKDVRTGKASIGRYRFGSEDKVFETPIRTGKPLTPNQLLDKHRSDRSLWREMGDRIKELPTKLRQGNLFFMHKDVMERKYRKLFSKVADAYGLAVNPLTAYIKAKAATATLVRKYEKKAYKLIKEVQKLDNKVYSEFKTLMRDITLAGTWVNKSLRDPANQHLWTKPNKKTGHTRLKDRFKAGGAQDAAAIRKRFVKFQNESPAAAKVLMKMAELAQEIVEAKREGALQALAAAYKLAPPVAKLVAKATTEAELKKAIPILTQHEVKALEPASTDTEEQKKSKSTKLKENENNKKALERSASVLEHTAIEGPYFPLRRYGEYVVSTGGEATKDEAYVSFFTTRAEAERHAKELNKQHKSKSGTDESVVFVSRKLRSSATKSNITDLVAELTAHIKEPSVQAQVRGAMIEALSQNTAYASQMKREGIDGVAADDMLKAYEEYVHVSKYSIGDLIKSQEIQEAFKDLRRLQSPREDLRGVDQDDIILIGEVVDELSKANKEEQQDRDISIFQKAVGLIGFFNFLGSPAYWVLNATQTYTVTLPYFYSKWGAVKGAAALASAQQTVLTAAFKATTGKDKSYEAFVKNLPEAAQRIVKRLEDDNVLQSTIAHEFGDIFSPSAIKKLMDSAPVVGKTVNIAATVMQKVPEAVEHFNRISTALAAYSLSEGDMTATIDAVQSTQFNYDTNNRARGLKTLATPLGGGARAIVTPAMMFKTYGLGIMRLLYGGMIDVAFKEGGRAEAGKLVLGLITSHTAFGGVAGGMMIAPIAAIIAAANAVFREAGDEWDPEEWAEELARDIAGDAAAEAVRRGIPAAVMGIDMSGSINLGNLMFMGDDRFDARDTGSIEEKVFKTITGPVGQYAATAIREGARYFTDDPRGSLIEFAGAMIPLKLARGLSKSIRYSMDGLKTDGNTLELLSAEEFNQAIQVGLGFRSAQMADTTDWFYGMKGREARRTDRRSKLLGLLVQAKTTAQRRVVWNKIRSFNKALPRGDRLTRGDEARLRSRRRSGQREYRREKARR